MSIDTRDFEVPATTQETLVVYSVTLVVYSWTCNHMGLNPSPLLRSLVLVAGMVLFACTQPRTPSQVDGALEAARRSESARLKPPGEPYHNAPTTALVDFRSPARVNDWQGVAASIDALPEQEQWLSGMRYVRAVAAKKLGDCGTALARFTGLAQMLPLLEDDIAAMTAECQLALGPFEAAAAYYGAQSSLAARYRAALAWQRAREPSRALRLLERVVARTTKHSAAGLHERARALRAEVAVELGQRRLARSDYLWLATVAAKPGADETYETLARKRLLKEQRLTRATALARRGRVERVKEELARLRTAPGPSPAVATIRRTLAQAHYRARSNDARAAKLYEEAARLSDYERASDLFTAASAWSRAGSVERAVSLYRRIIRLYPTTAAAERAYYAQARARYTTGDWAEAERSYTEYLRRYGRRSRFEVAARYERALTQLAAGRHVAAAAGFRRLSRLSPSTYPEPLLQHLEALALAGSGEGEKQNVAVERFEHIVQSFPFSFAALARAARLQQLGRAVAAPEALATKSLSSFDEELELPPKVALLVELGMYTAAEHALHKEEPKLRRRLYPRAGRALCRQYAMLNAGFRRYRFAADVVSTDVLRRVPTESSLWAWQCLYPRPYEPAVARLEARYALPRGLVYAVMRQESGFRPDVRSPAGAVGLLQLMPQTAERAARELALEHTVERLTQVQHNLELGAYYLKRLLDNFDRTVVLALASYNAGPHAVGRWLAGSDGLDLDTWVARIPYGETRNYVMRVMSNWSRYRYLEGTPNGATRLALDLPARLKVASNAY